MSISAHELEEIARRAAWHVWNYQHTENSEPMYKLQEFLTKILETMPSDDNIAARIIGMDEGLDSVIEILQNTLTADQRAQVKAALE